jgi:hypothetical protein
METVRFCTGIGAGRRLPQVGRSRVQPVLHVGDETERRIRHDPVPLRLLTRLRVRLLTLVALFVRLSDDHRARIPQDYPHVGVAGEVCVRRFGEVVVAQHRLVDVHGACKLRRYKHCRLIADEFAYRTCWGRRERD